MGASTIWWSTPNPWLVFNESGSKLYTNFEFCEEKNHRHFKNVLIYKSKQSSHILEDSVSVVQVGDIEQVTI